MSTRPHGTRPPVPTPPNALFDGTRLGLEGTMLSTLATSIPSGLHIALSVMLGYAVRLEDGLPPGPKDFAFVGFIFVALAALIAMSMVLFFLLAIPTMAYSMAMVSFMLRWAGKRRRKEKLTSTIIGSVMGLIVGVLSSALIFLLMDFHPTVSLYATILRWPEILTIDGISLLWFSLNPLFNAVAGAQIGWRLGKLIEEMTLYWFW
jgi:hypothetical protein